MIILGVDPGTIHLGYGLIRFERQDVSYIDSGVISLKRMIDIPKKLERIYESLSEIMRLHQPEMFSLETAFYGKNVQSALKIGFARGAAMLAAVHHDLQVFEYAPREVKKAVVGTGAASKEQVQFMVRTLLKLKPEPMPYDESDALAIALCQAFRFRSPSPAKKDWKTFVETFPERIIQ